MCKKYEVGSKIRITSDKSVLGSNDAIENYLGAIVTVKTVDEDNVYTVEEIDGIELSMADIEGQVNIDLKSWHEDTVCPCCGGSNFSNDIDLGDSEIYREYECNSCNSKWTERYNLSLVSAYRIDYKINSEKEDELLKLKEFALTLGYSIEQIENICLGKELECNQKVEPFKVATNDEKKYKFFWLDPAYIEGPENDASDLCEVIEWPTENFQINAYTFQMASDLFNDDNDGLEFGVEFAVHEFDGTQGDIVEARWFEFEEERAEYVKEFSSDYINIDDLDSYKYDLRFYDEDAIFYIKTINGSEAEVTKNELWRYINIDTGNYFVNIQEEDDELQLSINPVLKNGNMCCFLDTGAYVSSEEKMLPLDKLTLLKYLQTYYEEIEFDFDGNDEIESFWATIDSFRLDTDKSIIVKIKDMEDNYFDISWEEIKNSDFKE